MKHLTILILCSATIAALGCEKVERAMDDPRSLNAAMLNSYNVDAVDHAIIRQHTFYPFQFVTDGAQLNELGRRDVDVLARHFKEFPGALNVRRGNAAGALYEARARTVVDALAEAGVDVERMMVSNGLPGGDGVTSERVLIFQERAAQATSDTAETTTMER
ncbi:MAG: hypothetical protein IH830_11710 [Planctomycetes bacterium]|nr:hypothetical protein [Planctomycetota bacterium]